jgi:three-Cys-motif partner protein
VEPEIAHAYGLHTGLKLAAVRHASEAFSTIARSLVREQRIYRKSVYVDLFAGCGLNRMPMGELVAGTPFVGASWPFDQLILVEANADYFRVLTGRLEISPDPRVTVIDGDCNSAVDKVVSIVNERNSMVFVTVDQERLQANWSTLEALSSAFPALDLVVTVPSGAERELTAAEVTGRRSRRLESTVGMTVAEILSNADGSAQGALASRISAVLGRELGQASPIRDSDNRRLYDLHIYSRVTQGGSPYWNAYEAIYDRLSHLTAHDVAGVLNDLSGRGLPIG